MVDSAKLKTMEYYESHNIRELCLKKEESVVAGRMKKIRVRMTTKTSAE